MINRFLFLTIAIYVIYSPLTAFAEQLQITNKTFNTINHHKSASISCHVPEHSTPVYSGTLLSIDTPLYVEPNQFFKVKVFIKNTGNMPWISSSSGCPVHAATFLGTTRQQDRESVFHAPRVFGNTGWYASNRIKMKTMRVEAGEVAEFEFLAHAPEKAGIYREYFAPVIEGVTWIQDMAEFKFDMRVGQISEEEKLLKYTRDIMMSINLTDPQFWGGKKIVIDLSEQNMYLKLGDVTIKKFPVSTGKRKTPTPTGSTKIQFKQEVRVATKRPHYIMPLFMQFRKGGYGIHALPSLANDRGVYWREALNHIGTPRSHGCVRLLPKDAEFAYQFADIGTPVHVVR